MEKLEYEVFRIPAVVIFSSAFVLEMALTGKLFLERDAVKVSELMKWWAICAMLFLSSVNIYAAIEVLNKPVLDGALFTKLAYCLAGINLLAWVGVFHIDKWKAK